MLGTHLSTSFKGKNRQLGWLSIGYLLQDLNLGPLDLWFKILTAALLRFIEDKKFVLKFSVGLHISDSIFCQAELKTI